MNSKKKQLLTDFPWEDHYPRLVAFADWIIQGKHWNSDLLPKGQTAESIVQAVITKTFSEERNWDPERGDLLIWLKWVIRSEISHLAESASNKVEVHLDPIGEDESLAGDPNFKPYQPRSQKLCSKSSEELVMAAETDAEKVVAARSKIDALLEACSGKPELEKIVYAIVEGKCTAKPQELSNFLGKSVSEINQNLRTLRRRASKIRIEVRDGRE